MFRLLAFAAVLKVLSAFHLKDGYSTWEAECQTTGISSHPSDCRTFALCQNDSIQLYLCPPQSGYSQTQQACLPLYLLPNKCALQPEPDDEKFLKLMPVTHDNGDSVPVCSSQGQILGLLQCSAMNDEDLDVSQARRCIAAAKTCLPSGSRKLLVPKIDKQEQNLNQETEILTMTTSPAPALVPDVQNVGINPEGEEFPPVVCKELGLHCADESTIADCSDVSEEPLFSMSCSSLLHDDNGANVRGHCEEAACVLSTRGLALQLPVIEFSADNPDVPEQFLKECSENVGLRCINNQTLVACAGNLETTNYAISCMGNNSNADIGLQGYCNEDTDSCVFLTPEERASDHKLHQLRIGDNTQPYSENLTNISKVDKDDKYNNSWDVNKDEPRSIISDVLREDHDTSLFVLQVLSQDFSKNYSPLSSQYLLRGSHTSNKS